MEHGEVTYELQYSEDIDFSSAEIIRTADHRYRPDAPLPVSHLPPVGRRYFWHVRACSPTSCSEYSPTWWINLGRSNKDFNGDGYADLLVGAPNNNESGLNAGRAYIYLGGPGSFDTTADEILRNELSDSADDRFGSSVSWIDDFNGDGFSDAAVGAPSAGAGRVYIYFGGSGNTQNSIADVVISDGVGEGGVGLSSAAAGDVNGDGFSDLAVGNPYDNARGTFSGRVYLYLGGDTGTLDTADEILTGEIAGGRFSSTLTTAGDLDGDGLADLIVNEMMSADKLRTRCVSHTFMGSREEGAPLQQKALIVGDEYAPCLMQAAATGDINGDGRADFLSAINTADSRQIAFFRGAKPIDTAPIAVNQMETRGFYFIDSIGDVNGDGLVDISTRETTNILRCSLYLGQEGAVGYSLPGAPSALLGDCASGPARAGDINGDGLQDLITVNTSDGIIRIYLGTPGPVFDMNPDVLLDLGLNGGGGYQVATSGL